MNRADLERALEELHPSSFGWALGCCRHDRDEAEEALQTVYLKVLEGRARFDGRSSFKTWLFGVIRHTAMAQTRRRWMRQAAMFRWMRSSADPAPDLETDAVLEISERARQIARALSGLARRQREVLELVFYHEMTIEQAAATLGVSVGSARVHYQRGKRRLGALLQEMTAHE
jgi:RNA polymerase sigma-70 factor (ECF subfamily)